MAISFNMVITDEAITYARQASAVTGWYLTPYKWAITSSSGSLSTSRTTDSMFTTWVEQPFSGVYASGTNKLLHSVVIPPDAYSTDMNIGEIYFIYKDYYGNEFLYALAQPSETLTFTYGISQSYSFVFTLNNTTVADTISIEYTYPQDIEDHNQDPDAHEDYLLARDGSRTATGILVYSKDFSFTQNRQIPDLSHINSVKSTLNTSINSVKSDLEDLEEVVEAIQSVPTGTMVYWPKSTAPSGWLIRNGSAVSRTTYSALYSVIGTTYGTGNGSTTFNLPDDRGIFARGWAAGATTYDSGRSFGSLQSSGVPNITGTFFGESDSPSYSPSYSGAFYKTSTQNVVGVGKTDYDNYPTGFSASRCSSIYQSISEARPVNRAYLPIIKY